LPRNPSPPPKPTIYTYSNLLTSRIQDPRSIP